MFTPGASKMCTPRARQSRPSARPSSYQSSVSKLAAAAISAGYAVEASHHQCTPIGPSAEQQDLLLAGELAEHALHTSLDVGGWWGEPGMRAEHGGAVSNANLER